MITSRTAVALAGLGLALSMTSCSSTPSTEEANAAYCESSAVVQSEVSELKTLVTTDGTVEEVQAQADAVSKAIEDSAENREGLAKSVQAAVKVADEAFEATVKSIPADAQLSEVSTQYQGAVAAWDTAINAIRSEVGCA